MAYDLVVKGGHVLDPGQGLDGRRAGAPFGVDDHGRPARAAAEAEGALPGQLDLDGRLALSQAGPSWP